MASKKAQEINWKVAADRAVIGEKIELTSLPGFWVCPRRWSKTGEAEIHAAQARIFARQQGIRDAIIRDAKSEPLSEADAMAGALPESVKSRIMDALTQNLDGEVVDQIQSKIVKIAYGIHAHNFNGELEQGTMEWAKELADYSDVFDEVLKIVEEKNAPLAKMTSP